MEKLLFILLLITLAAYGQQQERVAIINTVDDRDSISFSDLAHLTNRLRETAVKILPKSRYGVMTTESIVAFLGDSQERAAKVCNEASCLAEIGRKVNADYVAQAHIGRFGGELSINFELYNSKSGNLIDQFTGSHKKIFGLLDIIDEKAPDLFTKMPGVSYNPKTAVPIIKGGIRDLEKTARYELDGERRYLVRLDTEPYGAVLSFDGMPITSCTKTPCNAELPAGAVRIIANLEQYEIADTIVYIKQNKQNINIILKPNFGVLEIKPAYSDGIGKDTHWNLTINGKSYSSLEPRLSPGDYNVTLSHECYEDINFKAGINKNSREVFNMSSYIELKKGGLDLSAELDGNPVSEPVYVNGRQAGETPFSDAVPVCADIGIGGDKDKINIKVVHNQTVNHKHLMGHFDPSSMYFYLSRTGVTASLPNGEERYVNSISAVLGFELINEVSLLGAGIFFGLGNGPAGIIEGFLGLEFKKLFWLSERRLALPISLGVALRVQNDYMENRLVAEFIGNPEFLNEPESYLDKTRIITAYRLDIMPAIDLQYFITKSFSIYAGYLYRISNDPEWGFEYNGDYFKVPERYVPFTKSRESGMLRFGVKYGGRYGGSIEEK